MRHPPVAEECLVPRFTCPACGQAVVTLRQKAAATSFDPAHCRHCRAPVYPSGKKTYLLRSVEAFIVSAVIVLAFVEFAWSLIAVIVGVIVVIELLILFVVPLVRLQRQEPAP